MIAVVVAWQNEVCWGFCVFLSCFHSCPGELFRVWCVVILQEDSSYTDFIFIFFLMCSHWEQLLSEYKKAPALMMTGKSSLWDLGAKGREQMGTACRGTAWNPSGEQGFQIIASAFLNVSGD